MAHLLLPLRRSTPPVLARVLGDRLQQSRRDAASLIAELQPRMPSLPYPAHTVSPVAVAEDRLPKPCAAEGPFAPNTALQAATRLFEGQVQGSESVAVGPDGTLWMLDKFGNCWTAKQEGEAGEEASDAASAAASVQGTAKGQAPGSSSSGGSGGSAVRYRLDPAEPLCYVGPGRPLGFHHDAQGNLVFCDSLKGLMLLERSSTGGSGGGSSGSSGGDGPRGGHWRLRCLANYAAGRPISYANDLDIAADGRIFFSDSTAIPVALNEVSPRPWYDTMRSYILTMHHGAPTGRLLVHSPADGGTRQLVGDLWFANGVALAPDESFVAVVETPSMRVRRYWLAGPKAGTLDTLIDRLPGWPDNICRSSDGNFWLCLVVPDMPVLHKLMRHPWARSIFSRLPEWLQPRKPQWGCVVKVSPAGEVLQVLMDPAGERVSHVSSVTEHQGRLFIGTLAKDYVSVLDLRQVAAAGAAAGTAGMAAGVVPGKAAAAAAAGAAAGGGTAGGAAAAVKTE